MTLEEFRAAFNAEVLAWAAGRPGLEVFFENGPPPDLDRVGTPWLDTSIRRIDSRALTIGQGFGPRGRSYCGLVLSVYHKQGEGTGDVDGILDSLFEHFRSRHLGAATIGHPTPLIEAPPYRGWYRQGWIFPAHYDG